MKKLNLCILLFCCFSVFYSIEANAQKGELIAYIYASQLNGIDDSDITILAGDIPILIKGTTNIMVQYKQSAKKSKPLPATRIRVFYNEESGVKVATKIVSEVLMVPGFRLVKPIPRYIPETAISGIGMGNLSDLGKISSWGWSVIMEARIYKGVRIFFDASNYKYKQILADKGSTQVPLHIGTGTFIDLPDGAKYNTETTIMRLGMKYTFLREKDFQPWIGLGYGFSHCLIQYNSLDDKHTYGAAVDYKFRSSILFGVDYRKYGTITNFFEAISPVANYSMDLFGGKYSTFDGMTYPTPRIGIGFSAF